MKNLFKYLFTLSVSGILISACSPQKSAPKVESIGGSSDFFQITVDDVEAKDSAWVRPTDCRANIEKVLCEVDDEGSWGSSLQRKCLGGEKQYAPFFESIYDDLDEINKEMFCSLRRIFIEREFYATGYASLVYQRKQDGNIEILPGAIMGVRRSLLHTTPNFAQWLSWKEQKNYVENFEEFKVPLQYPIYEVPKVDISLLQYVIVHEFGHMLDFANKINNETVKDPKCYENVETEDDYQRECEPKTDLSSWTAFSWENRYNILPHKNFPGRDKLCFYSCEDYMTTPEMVEFYKGLNKSDFISSYGASNVMDDFAESWAVRWMIERKDADLVLHADKDVAVDSRSLYNSENFRLKREYMNKFSKGKVLYP